MRATSAHRWRVGRMFYAMLKHRIKKEPSLLTRQAFIPSFRPCNYIIISATQKVPTLFIKKRVGNTVFPAKSVGKSVGLPNLYTDEAKGEAYEKNIFILYGIIIFIACAVRLQQSRG